MHLAPAQRIFLRAEVTRDLLQASVSALSFGLSAQRVRASKIPEASKLILMVWPAVENLPSHGMLISLACPVQIGDVHGLAGLVQLLFHAGLILTGEVNLKVGPICVVSYAA